MAYTKTAANLLASYLETVDVQSDLSASLEFGTNLFIGEMLGNSEYEEAVTIVPYGGEPPITNRQTAAVQLNFKSVSRQKALGIMQKLINDLDGSSMGGTGLVRAVQSIPQIFPSIEGGELIVALANFTIKHVVI